jgi:hypothetical protein
LSRVELTDEVRQFLMVFIGTVEELEVLLLLQRRVGAALSAEIVDAELMLGTPFAFTILEELAAKGLLLKEGSDAPVFSYAPDAALAIQVDAVARAYSSARLAITSRISSNAVVRARTSAIQSFANAFMLKKGRKKDG